MVSYYQGSTVPLQVNFYQYDGGPAVDVSGLTVSITYVPTSTVVVNASTAYTHPATGVYIYNWAIGASQTVGDYLVVWNHSTSSANEVVNVIAASTASGSSATPDGAFYASREELKRVLDVQSTANSDTQIDRALAAGTSAVEGFLHRRFFPWSGTRYLDWPTDSWSNRTYRLWLDDEQIVSLTSLSSGGTTIPSSDYVLYPNDGPPYDRIETNRSTSSVFQSGDTRQNAISINGVFGYDLNEKLVGVLSGSINSSATTLIVSNGAQLGVGNVIRIDGERMILTDRSWADSGQNIGADLESSQKAQSVSVSNGSSLNVGETILVDSEQMLITAISGNTLTVKRNWNGTTLSAHTSGADIYIDRQFTVTRAVLGTGASSHSSTNSVYLHVIPGLVKELCLAEAITTYMQESAGWARTSGSEENQREVSGRGINILRKLAKASYGRQARMRAV